MTLILVVSIFAIKLFRDFLAGLVLVHVESERSRSDRPESMGVNARSRVKGGVFSFLTALSRL